MATRESLLLRLLDGDETNGIILRELPDILDADLLHLADADGLIEFGCRDGSQWYFNSITNGQYVPMEKYIGIAKSQDAESPDLLIHIRLTAAGASEARRIRLLSKPKPMEDAIPPTWKQVRCKALCDALEIDQETLVKKLKNEIPSRKVNNQLYWVDPESLLLTSEKLATLFKTKAKVRKKSD